MLVNIEVGNPIVQSWGLNIQQIRKLVGTAMDPNTVTPPQIISTQLPTFSVNSTPAGAFFDLHFDRGMAGISSLFACTKLWAFFPPTKMNREAWVKAQCPTVAKEGSSDSPGTKTLLESLCGILEYPLVVFTRQNETILVPPGWLHAVHTLQAGLLLGTDFIRDIPHHLHRAVEALVDEWMQAKSSNVNIAGES